LNSVSNPSPDGGLNVLKDLLWKERYNADKKSPWIVVIFGTEEEDTTRLLVAAIQTNHGTVTALTVRRINNLQGGAVRSGLMQNMLQLQKAFLVMKV
jgi:hypothetical protein